jgi:predicted CoA-binding protein
MSQAIQDFIRGKRIAVVGVSRSGKKFGNTACAELQRRGYQVFVVHPEAREIDGQRCYPNLTALQGQVDGVLVCVPSTQAEAVMREAVQIGLKNIWLQQGAESPEVLAAAQGLGVMPVSGKCILMYAQPVRSFHAFHRVIAKVFGQLE